ncbi:unnamed protein product [Dovyalis caffra]|uniref:Uncharacterized protein n=1 Tax=Dovyalis caffra TaxID=77055 RepID=A0AAV1R1B3_9ROSI|nr:unnamed protein product [Dovyalis caffra]
MERGVSEKEDDNERKLKAILFHQVEDIPNQAPNILEQTKMEKPCISSTSHHGSYWLGSCQVSG